MVHTLRGENARVDRGHTRVYLRLKDIAFRLSFLSDIQGETASEASGNDKFEANISTHTHVPKYARTYIHTYTRIYRYIGYIQANDTNARRVAGQIGGDDLSRDDYRLLRVNDETFTP